MKKWFLRIAVVVGLVFLTLVGAAFWSDSDVATLTDRASNPDAATIKPEWPGTPVDQHGRYMNHEFPFLPKTRELLQWQLASNRFEEEKANDTFRPQVLDPSGFLASDDDGLIWLGHASFYVRMAGRGILIDPIFDTPSFVTRYAEVPSLLDQLRRVDYVLLSHDHRDHTDEETLRKIAQKFPDAKFLAGLGTEDLIKDWTTPTNPTATTGWFQEFAIGDTDIKVYFLPVRHWSRRGLFDTNQRLWGGYVIESGETTIYHGGDSGYGRHYRETGELFPEIDYVLLGIGAYEPRWFMEANHNNPADVVEAFRDMGGRVLVPMHYGTFDLSDEPPGAPLRELTIAAENGKIADKIKVLQINEHINFGK